jgi:hypothetical protein
MDAAIAVLRAQGATVELIDTYDVRIGQPQLGTCIARPAPTDLTCSTVLLYGFKRDLNAYLAATPAAPSRTLAEVIAFNNAFVPPMKYGQVIAIGADALDVSPGSADTARYPGSWSHSLPADLGRVSRYGERLGLAFQIADDILDALGQTAAGEGAESSHNERKKATYPSVVGIPQARETLKELLQLCLDELATYGAQAVPLKAIARHIVSRAIHGDSKSLSEEINS